MTESTSDSPWATFGFSVSLRVNHPHASTEKVSKALGLRPVRAWVAGEQRTTPTGARLTGVYRDSYCCYRSAEGVGPDALEKCVRALTRKLCKHAAFLQSWRRAGGTLNYYLVVHGEAAMGFTLAPELLADIGRLGIELGVEALRARQRS